MHVKLQGLYLRKHNKMLISDLCYIQCNIKQALFIIMPIKGPSERVIYEMNNHAATYNNLPYEQRRKSRKSLTLP